MLQNEVSDVWAWLSKMGKKDRVWESIQHMQRAKRYPLLLEVMLHSRQNSAIFNCSQSCFYCCMSVGIVGHCPALGMENRCSVCRWWSSLAYLFSLVLNWRELGWYSGEGNVCIFSTKTLRYPKEQVCKQTISFPFGHCWNSLLGDSGRVFCSVLVAFFLEEP